MGCAAFSQDRATLAAASFYKSKVKLFDAATGELHTEINLRPYYQVIAATCSHDSFLFITVAEPLRRVLAITSFSTNGTHIERNELDLYGLPLGHRHHFMSAFSRDASIMVIQVVDTSRCNKIALYDVATGKLRLKKRPLARGVG